MNRDHLIQLARMALCRAVLEARDAARRIVAEADSGKAMVSQAIELLECCLFVDIMADRWGHPLLNPRWAKLAFARWNGKERRVRQILGRHPQSVRRLAKRLLPDLEYRGQAAVSLIRWMAQSQQEDSHGDPNLSV